MFGPAVHVPHRTSDSHRKVSPPRSTSYETHTVALEEQLEGTRITRKGDTSTQIAPPPLKVVAAGKQCVSGQPLHPLKHALQIFTDVSKEGWGAHLNERTARGTWSLPDNKLHINHLKLKAVFLTLKEFQHLCSNNIVLVATDNTTVVAYINKEGGMKSGPLCALLWRILPWCTRRQVTLKARHIPGWLNVIADKLSRLGQTIQTEWSLHPEVFQAIFFLVAPAPSGSVCRQVQQQTSTVCLTGSRAPSMGSGCTQYLSIKTNSVEYRDNTLQLGY